MQMQKIKEKYKKHWIIYTILLIPIVGVFVLVVFINYNSDTNSFSCGYSETEFPLPDYLKDAKIIFEKSVYSRENLGSGYGCVSAFSDSNHLVNIISTDKNSVTQDKIPDGTEFTVYKRIYTRCDSISCMDQGGGNDQILLKDSQGKIWTINPTYFDEKKWAPYEGVFKAGYYKDNVRLGNFVPEPTSYNNSEFNMDDYKWTK